MNLKSELPVKVMAFPHWHTDDTEVGIALAKATFHLTAEGTTPVMPAPDIEMVDEFEGDPANSALISEQDIAPAKTSTDLIVRGVARTLNAEERPDWPVKVEIADVVSYGFHVRGPSEWSKSLGRWRLGQPTPVSEVPLRYAMAYGGTVGEGEDAVCFEQNPAGKGFMTKAALDDATTFAAPQIGLLGEFMDADPLIPMAVHGTLPIAKAWLPRRSLAGTFDDAWERNRHPRMPLDYDIGFWNMAGRGLQISPFLKGDEKIALTGFSHSRERVTLRLPGAMLALQSQTDPGQPVVPMNLDTVDLDVTEVDDGKVAITLLWRAMVPDRAAYEQCSIVRG